ncbi:MAG: hypothetical protein K2X68_05830, partial [Novosphingobium sp.]|nr:hypothetical protein [Novosphingobium sp.]
MIGYVTLGTNDLARGAAFYDALAAELGRQRMYEWEAAIAWGEAGGAAGIGLMKPYNGEPATVGNSRSRYSSFFRARVSRALRLPLSLCQ